MNQVQSQVQSQVLSPCGAGSYPHAGGCEGCRRNGVCNVCGGVLERSTCCTNGRCGGCHGKHCTPGGESSPGHGYGEIARVKGQVNTLFKWISDKSSTREQWRLLHEAWHRGDRLEISHDLYWYYLEVLPPIYMRRANVHLVSDDRIVADFGFAEGTERITAFWTMGGRYFLQQTWEMNRG
jgi:hypothetical protein